MSRSLAILVPVWQEYQWIAPFTEECLGKWWPNHPPLYFCGLGERKLLRGENLPLGEGVDRCNWTAILHDGVQQLISRGIEYSYLIAEEHVPLDRCHEQVLNEVLPGLMDSLPAVYLSLMGWDNRRYTSKSPIVSPYAFKHLNGRRDPRFHLHPALWRMDALEVCCQVALEDPSKNGSAWHFEKINDKAPLLHHQDWMQQCYQISGQELSLKMPGKVQKALSSLERFFFHKLMALYPLIPFRSLADWWFRFAGFDHFFFDGPYPMVFSGIMVKGKINPFLHRWLQKGSEGTNLLHRLQSAFQSSR